jgi:hypothetical protein
MIARRTPDACHTSRDMYARAASGPVDHYEIDG